MNKNVLWLCVILLIAYLSLVYCENVDSETEAEQRDDSAEDNTSLTDMVEEARRRRRRHGLWGHHHHMWGWHALAIAYWVKVKLVIVSFFVGSAIFLGLRYFWPHKCHSEVVHESPVIYDHPPHTVDHIPYSLDHSSHFDHHDYSSFSDHHDFSPTGPYSGYSGGYSDVDPTSSADIVDPTAPTSTHSFKKRDVSEQETPRAAKPEELIGDFMFQFLGLDSPACRRRFICEMEFRSKINPMTDMAFRIVGQSFFNQYTNARNTAAQATSFAECASVNPECVFIEQNETDDTPATEEAEAEVVDEGETVEEAEEVTATVESNDIPSGDDMESQNIANLRAERRVNNVRRHRTLEMNA